MAKKRRRNPPSREKYEKENPVVSFRVPRTDNDRFIAIREKLGMSHGDVYKAGLGVIEVKVRAEEEVRQEAYDKGWEDGIEAAEGLYAVSCPCSKCGKKKTVTDEDEKKAICRFMMANRWHHADCNDLYS